MIFGQVRHVTVQGENGPLAMVGLTPREAQTLWLICQALGNKEIAAEMQNSVQTVKTRIRSMCVELGRGTRLELMRFALERPSILAGDFVEAAPHPSNCDCPSPYCSAMRLAR